MDPRWWKGYSQFSNRTGSIKELKVMAVDIAQCVFVHFLLLNKHGQLIYEVVLCMPPRRESHLSALVSCTV